jgi:hypothetical protein
MPPPLTKEPAADECKSNFRNETGEIPVAGEYPDNVIFLGTTEPPNPHDHFSSFQLIIFQVTRYILLFLSSAALFHE